MGKFDFEISPEFIKQLGRLADVERIAPKMIDEAIPILLDNVKAETAQHKRTGDMYKSINPQSVKPRAATLRLFDRERPQRHQKYGEDGGSGRQKQSPTPILTKAIKDGNRG